MTDQEQKCRRKQDRPEINILAKQNRIGAKMLEEKDSPGTRNKNARENRTDFMSKNTRENKTKQEQNYW